MKQNLCLGHLVQNHPLRVNLLQERPTGNTVAAAEGRYTTAPYLFPAYGVNQFIVNTLVVGGLAPARGLPESDSG